MVGDFMSRIYLVRHGETEWNREQRSQGCSNDIPLSEAGLLQAEAVAKRIMDEKIDMVFSSTLNRAYQTAEKIATYHKLKVEKCSEFIELNCGTWEGRCFPELKEQYSEIYTVWRSTPHLAEIPGGESIAKLKERTMKKLLSLINANPDKNILVVSHGITIKVLVTVILNMDLGCIHRIRQDNTAINIFEYDINNKSFDIITLNDIGHLRGIADMKIGSFEMK
jgi:phosphoserine phosphatase